MKNITILILLICTEINGQQIRSIDFTAGDMVYSSIDDIIYAVGGLRKSKSEAKGLYAINKTTLETKLLLPSINNQSFLELKLSPDGKYLAVSVINSDTSILVYNIPDFTLNYIIEVPDKQIPFRSFDLLFNEGYLALFHNDSLAFYKNGVRLPQTFYIGAEATIEGTGLPGGVLVLYRGYAVFVVEFNENGYVELQPYVKRSAIRRPVKCQSGDCVNGNGIVFRIVSDSVKLRGKIGATVVLHTDINEVKYSKIVPNVKEGSLFGYIYGRDIFIEKYDLQTLSFVESVKKSMPEDIDNIIYLGSNFEFVARGASKLYFLMNCTNKTKPEWGAPYEMHTLICQQGNVVRHKPSGVDHMYSESGDLIDSIIMLGNYKEFFFKTIDADGCLSPNSDTLYVEIKKTPVTPTISSLSKSGRFVRQDSVVRCEGGNAFLNSGAGSANTVLWSNGEFGELISTDFLGDIYSVVRSPEGCYSDTSNIVNISKNSIVVSRAPKIMNRYQFESNYECRLSSTNYLYAEKGYSKYIWYQGNGLGLSYEKKLKIGYFKNNESFEYNLHGLDSNACWTNWNEGSIIEGDQVATPEITGNQSGLYTRDDYYQYQWFKNDEKVLNSDTKYFFPNGLGKYHLIVSNGKCWSKKSNVKTIR